MPVSAQWPIPLSGTSLGCEVPYRGEITEPAAGGVCSASLGFCQQKWLSPNCRAVPWILHWCYGWKVPGLFSQCSDTSETDHRIGEGKECKVEFLCVNHRLSISHVHVGLQTAETGSVKHCLKSVAPLLFIGRLDGILKMVVNLEVTFTTNCPHLSPLSHAPWRFSSSLYHGRSTQDSLPRFLNIAQIKAASPETDLDGHVPDW